MFRTRPPFPASRGPAFAAALAAASLLGAVVAAPGLAAGTGAPTYPNAVNKMPDLPPGSPMFQLETADAVSKVDAWYGAHLPKTCTHQTAQGGAKYGCPNVNIMITASNGKTLITHMSSGMPGH